VIEKHGGASSFETEPGRGTTFSIRLPIAEQPAEEFDVLVPVAETQAV